MHIGPAPPRHAGDEGPILPALHLWFWHRQRGAAVPTAQDGPARPPAAHGGPAGEDPGLR